MLVIPPVFLLPRLGNFAYRLPGRWRVAATEFPGTLGETRRVDHPATCPRIQPSHQGVSHVSSFCPAFLSDCHAGRRREEGVSMDPCPCSPAPAHRVSACATPRCSTQPATAAAGYGPRSQFDCYWQEDGAFDEPCHGLRHLCGHHPGCDEGLATGPLPHGDPRPGGQGLCPLWRPTTGGPATRDPGPGTLSILLSVLAVAYAAAWVGDRPPRSATPNEGSCGPCCRLMGAGSASRCRWGGAARAMHTRAGGGMIYSARTEIESAQTRRQRSARLRAGM